MYFCYLLTYDRFMAQIVKLLFDSLIEYQGHISPQINGLRNLLMMILNYCIVKYGTENIYNMLNGFYGNEYGNWFYIYCWSGQYVSNKLCQ